MSPQTTTTITITDADYQALERELVLEVLALRRERAVFVRTIAELTHEGQLLRRALAEAAPAPDPAPKKQRSARP